MGKDERSNFSSDKIKGVENCKYLGVVLNKIGNRENEILEKINKEGAV